MSKNTAIGQSIHSTLKFLNWYRVKDAETASSVYEVLISPDTNKLDIVWIYDDIEEDDELHTDVFDGSWGYEQATYPYLNEYETIGEWLEDEIEDDSYDSAWRDEGLGSFKPISDVIGEDIDHLPWISIKRLDNALQGFKNYYIEKGLEAELEEL